MPNALVAGGSSGSAPRSHACSTRRGTSIAGEIAAPGLAVYGATKAAVINFARSVNAELEGDGVRATALCPGCVDTPMAAWTGLPSEQMIQPEDCAEIVRLLLRPSPATRIPQVVVEHLGAESA